MVVKKIAKRIAALGTGAVLVGSSIMGASAAELSQYPSQYIKDGKFTGVMVVGDKAAAEDVIGVSDIAISLQAAAVKKVSSGGSSVSVEGGWMVGEDSNDQLELSENRGTDNTESIGNIVGQSFIDDSELPEVLGDGEASNSKGSAPYTQNLYFEQTGTGYVIHIESDQSDETADFLVFDDDEQLARYELEFTSALETDIEAQTGDDNLEDLEDVELTMLGMTYTIVTATQSAANAVHLTMMGGSNRDTMLEGATKTYNVGGNDYEVTLTYVDDDEAQFQVNGETTQKLQDGETDKLADGTTLGVSEILYQDYAGGIHSATFFLGAQKVELIDSNIENTGSSNELEVDDETIDGVDVIIEGTDDTSEVTIDSISVNMTAQDTYYVPAGGKLSENPDLDEIDLLFTRSWDVEYAGLTTEDVTSIAITSAGDDNYNLEFVDGSGNMVDVPLAYASGGSAVRLGDEDDDLIVRENESTIDTDDYFVVTDYGDESGERQTYVLQYMSADALSDENPVIRFKDMGSGETIERVLSAGTQTSYSNLSTGNPTVVTELAQIKLGGGTFRVYNFSSTANDDFNILVDMDGSGRIGGGETLDGEANTVVINTDDGAEIGISELGTDFVNVTISTPNSDDFDDMTPSDVTITVSASSAELDLASGANTVVSFLSPDDDEDNTYAYTSYGALFKLSSQSDNPDELWVEYPTNQRLPQVFITGSGAAFTEVSASEGDAVQVQKIDVGATKLASEVANINAVNSILVGGPCANAAAATVMGNPADCTAGFQPGVGKISMYDVGNGNVAMLVAGYSALDTRNAAQVVANYKTYAGKLTGSAVEVKKVNNQLTVATPAAPVAMTEEDEETETAEDNETA